MLRETIRKPYIEITYSVLSLQGLELSLQKGGNMILCDCSSIPTNMMTKGVGGNLLKLEKKRKKLPDRKSPGSISNCPENNYQMVFPDLKNILKKIPSQCGFSSDISSMFGVKLCCQFHFISHVFRLYHPPLTSVSGKQSLCGANARWAGTRLSLTYAVAKRSSAVCLERDS